MFFSITLRSLLHIFRTEPLKDDGIRILFCTVVLLRITHRPCKDGRAFPAQPPDQPRIDLMQLITDKVGLTDKIHAQFLYDKQQIRKQEPFVFAGGIFFDFP